MWDHLSVEQEKRWRPYRMLRLEPFLEHRGHAVTGTKMRQKLNLTTLAQRRKVYTLKAVNSQVHPRVYISPS